MFKPSSRKLLVAVLVLLILAAGDSALAQGAVQRLTNVGDVLTFAWAADSTGLYVGREAGVVTLSSERAQIITDLYRVSTTRQLSGQLVENANLFTPGVSGQVAFVQLEANGAARVGVLAPDGAVRDVGPVEWGRTPQWAEQDRELVIVGRQIRHLRAESGAVSTEAALQATPQAAEFAPQSGALAYVADDGLHLVRAGVDRVVLASDAQRRVLPHLAWSHNGRWLAVIASERGVDSTLYLVDSARDTVESLVSVRQEVLAGLDWSPDDNKLVLMRTPLGSSTAHLTEIWQVARGGGTAHALTGRIAASQLRYSPDGRALAVLSAGDVWLIELDAAGKPRGSLAALEREPAAPRGPDRVTGQLIPPSTIRVRHDAANTCRSVPLGQIDTIDFETYVKRVVPAEVYPTWHAEALKVQAVAARSYAWFYVLLHTGWSYDVTDTTAYQYMCDQRYASTDAAVDATHGQYAGYNGSVIFAAYGAENGDPTLDNTWGNPYLLAVDDPVGFGRTRAGNGIGMSQWGAQRWASTYGWNYQAILTHYYTGVTIEAPASQGGDAALPIGALVEPWSGWGITSNDVRLVVNASDDSAGVASIDLVATWQQGGGHNETIAQLQGGARSWVWDVSALPNQTGITVTPVIRDAAGQATNGASVQFDLDRQLPTGTLDGPEWTDSVDITLDLTASDSGGSGLAGVGLSNNWLWEGENQYVQANSGSVAADSGALNGHALAGISGVNPAGVWYGPYTTALDGGQAYLACFRLRTNAPGLPDEVALLDVTDAGGTVILGLERVRGTDFASAQYQEFCVDFDLPSAPSGLEFRVAYRGTASLWLDRILLTRYPVDFASQLPWTLESGDGVKRVVAKFLDGAGNVSADAATLISLGISPDPTPTPTLLPRIWLPFLIEQAP